MVERAITRFIDVQITKDNPGVSVAGFGTLLAITDSPLLTTTSRVKGFTSVASAATFFGDGSEEELYSDAYFNQDPFNDNLPEEILFGRYADTGTSAVLECGDSPTTDIDTWQAVEDGEFSITVDGVLDEVTGLDFSSVTSLDDVATVITVALTNGVCTYNQINRFVFTSEETGTDSTITLLTTIVTPTGTDISGNDGSTNYLNGEEEVSVTNTGGSILSQGAGTSASLSGGTSPETTIATWNSVTDGEFAITIDGTLEEPTGLDFNAATDMDDIALVINAGLTLATCTWSGTVFEFTSLTSGVTSTITFLSTVATPAGTDISGASFCDCDDSSDGTLTQGTNAEDFNTALQAIIDVNNGWYGMGALKKFRDTSDAEDMADEIESLIKTFIIATNDSNTVVTGSTSTFAYYLKDANYKRSGCIYHNNSDVYPDASWSGQQMPKDIGTTNWSFKTLAGIAEGATVDIDPVSLTQPQIDAAMAVNCNVYTTTLGADFAYLGTMGGGKNADKDGEYIDIIRNIDFLQARVEEGLMSLLLEKDIIPFTDAGISIVNNRLKSTLDTYGVKQGILVEDTVETFFPKRSDVSSTDRDDRLLPGGTFQGELQGGINKVIVRGTVYI